MCLHVFQVARYVPFDLDRIDNYALKHDGHLPSSNSPFSFIRPVFPWSVAATFVRFAFAIAVEPFPRGLRLSGEAFREHHQSVNFLAVLAQYANGVRRAVAVGISNLYLPAGDVMPGLLFVTALYFIDSGHARCIPCDRSSKKKLRRAHDFCFRDTVGTTQIIFTKEIDTCPAWIPSKPCCRTSSKTSTTRKNN
jgi:hypothetical protein